MDIVNVFSNKLAEATGLPTYHAAGILRLAIKDAGKDPAAPITYAEFKNIAQVHVQKRLTALNLNNASGAVNQLVTAATMQQSLFTIGSR